MGQKQEEEKKRAKEGEAGDEGNAFPSLTPPHFFHAGKTPKISYLGLSTFFAPQPHGNAYYAGFK